MSPSNWGRFEAGKAAWRIPFRLRTTSALLPIPRRGNRRQSSPLYSSLSLLLVKRKLPEVPGIALPPAQKFEFRVESRRGAVAARSPLRFLSPLIEPDVRISRIRLSDRIHRKAHARAPRCTRRSRNTPRGPKISSAVQRCVPREEILCRRLRKCRTRAATWLSTARYAGNRVP